METIENAAHKAAHKAAYDATDTAERALDAAEIKAIDARLVALKAGGAAYQIAFEAGRGVTEASRAYVAAYEATYDATHEAAYDVIADTLDAAEIHLAILALGAQ